MTNQRLEEDAVIVECVLDESPNKVWRALTEPELLAAWLMENDFRAEEGAQFTFAPLGPDAPEGSVSCEILELKPERLLRFAWRGSEEHSDSDGHQLDSVVSFELRPSDGGGTWLRVVHAGLAVRADAGSNVLPLRRRHAVTPKMLRMAA